MHPDKNLYARPPNVARSLYTSLQFLKEVRKVRVLLPTAHHLPEGTPKELSHYTREEHVVGILSHIAKPANGIPRSMAFKYLHHCG